MTTRHSVIPRTMCLIFHHNEILLMKASEKKDFAGMYDPVGGHVEIGEDILSSANREIFEETGLHVENTKLRGIIHVTNFFEKNIMMFITVSNSETKSVYSNDEGELEWIKVSEIEDYPILEDIKPLIKRVLDLQPDELLYGVSEFNGKNKLLSLNLTTH